MPKLVWYNGVVMPLEEAKVSAADHAHLYGDGLFEGIRIYNSRIFKLDEHLERLYHGIAYLGFKMKFSRAQLRELIIETCAKAEIPEGYIRLNVTRGTGLGLDPKNIDQDPNVMIMINTLSLYSQEQYERGLNVVTSPFRVIPPDALDPRIKCIGRYAGNILAKQDGNRRGAGEALMLNHKGEIAECTGDNVFLIQGGIVRTPSPTSGILDGITRRTAISIARDLGYEVREEWLTLFDAFSADEAFLTGTAAEVIAMTSLDGHVYGDGNVGPITRQISNKYREITHTTGVPFALHAV